MELCLIAFAFLWAPFTYGSDLCSPSSINGGIIGLDGHFSLNNNLIESNVDASGVSPDIEYLWLWNPNEVPFNNGNNG